MKWIESLTAQDIVSIASAGISAVALVVFILVLLKEKGPSKAATAIIIIGLILTTFAELATRFMDNIVDPHSRISVTLTPDSSSIAQFLPADAGAPLSARAHLWVDSGAPECNPNALKFNSSANACLVFAQDFELGKQKEAIHVSVDPVMRELRDRVLKLTAVSASMVAEQRAHASPNIPFDSLPIADDTAPR